MSATKHNFLDPLVKLTRSDLKPILQFYKRLCVGSKIEDSWDNESLDVDWSVVDSSVMEAYNLSREVLDGVVELAEEKTEHEVNFNFKMWVNL